MKSYPRFTPLQPSHTPCSFPQKLSQVNNLPSRVGAGYGEDDDDSDDDDFLANEAKAWFEADMQGEEKDRWGYGTGGVFILPQDNGDETSPFKVIGEPKKSRHVATEDEGDGVGMVRDLPQSGEDSEEEEEGDDTILAVTSSVIPSPAKPPAQVPAMRMSPRKAKAVKREEERTKQEKHVQVRMGVGLT